MTANQTANVVTEPLRVSDVTTVNRHELKIELDNAIKFISSRIG